MRALVLVMVVTSFATPAAAQTYVAGGIGAAITRSYSSSTDRSSFDGSNSEVVAWMLRAGTSVTSVFGVELEFVRDGEVDIDYGPIIYAEALDARVLPVLNAVAPAIFPAPQISTRQRTAVWNATAFVRKPIGARADLVFLGGVGVSRVVQDSRFSFAPFGLSIRAESRTETTAYGVGPIVGAEARIGLTDHLNLTPGLRVQSLGNDLTTGIVMRPSVTIGWTF